MILKANNVTEALRELSNSLEREISEYKSKIDETIPKPKKYKELPKLQEYIISSCSYNALTLQSPCNNMFKKSSYYSSELNEINDLKDLEERKKKILEIVEKFKNNCEKIIAENVEIKAHNDKIAEKIGLIMQELGVGGSYSTWEYKTNRSSRKTSQIHSAGYIGDLNRLLGYPPTIPLNIEQFKTNIEKEYKEIIAKIREKEKEKLKEKAKKEKEHSFALIRAKYTPDNALSDYEDIRDKILSKDKYLALAYWLEKNRNDWNDGYNYAQKGIDSFVVENKEDEEIQKNIIDLIESGRNDGDIDGRVFRDCEFNYNFLYSKVEKELLNDLKKLGEFDDEF